MSSTASGRFTRSAGLRWRNGARLDRFVGPRVFCEVALELVPLNRRHFHAASAVRRFRDCIDSYVEGKGARGGLEAGGKVVRAACGGALRRAGGGGPRWRKSRTVRLGAVGGAIGCWLPRHPRTSALPPALPVRAHAQCPPNRDSGLRGPEKSDARAGRARASATVRACARSLIPQTNETNAAVELQVFAQYDWMPEPLF